MRSSGPGIMVTAAFIGPGTLTTCTLAGANFGHALLWALLFSVVATYILQEMCARLGVVTQRGLGESLRKQFTSPLPRALVIATVVGAIVVGNSAYQGGNISGASLGLQALVGDSAPFGAKVWPILIGMAALILLWTGSLQGLEWALLLLVLAMSLAFLATFLMADIEIGSFLSGLLVPGMPDGATLTVAALIGTTIVPYNLFLHAAAARDHWNEPQELGAARRDLALSLGLGGLISIAIVSTAAAAFFQQQVEIHSAADLGTQLQPLFGSWALLFTSLGLFAAGLSSAVTAPLAGAYALGGILGWKSSLTDWRIRSVWLTILIAGTITAASGFKPVSIIWFAQLINAVLLPLIVLFLLVAMNQRESLGKYRNGPVQNTLGMFVLALTIALSARTFWILLVS